MNRTEEISVIVPTLGGESVVTTIKNLNEGTVVPSEILICIPEEKAERVAHLQTENVRVLSTPVRGQVAQRAYGFRRARYPLVLQLDDDISLDSQALEKLASACRAMGTGNAVAPIYRDVQTGRALHSFHNGATGWLQDVYAFIICGAPWGRGRMGVISPAGVAYPVDEALCGMHPVEVQWQPGGCVLSYQCDLITEDFYPFTGKAFCEDLVHSLLRRRKGARLWIVPGAYCATASGTAADTLLSMSAELKARRLVVRLCDGHPWRLGIWAITDSFKRAIDVFTRTIFTRR